MTPKEFQGSPRMPRNREEGRRNAKEHLRMLRDNEEY